MRTLRLLALLLLCPADPARADGAAAPSRFEEGSRLYAAGHFDDALGEFSAAYENEPRPQLLFLIGQCHRHLGQHEEALFFFRGYLQRGGDVADRALAEALIAEEQERLLAPLPAATAREVGPRDDHAASPAGARWYRRWWVWAAAAVVVGGAATGIALGVAAQRPLPSGGLGTIDARH